MEDKKIDIAENEQKLDEGISLMECDVCGQLKEFLALCEMCKILGDNNGRSTKDT